MDMPPDSAASDVLIGYGVFTLAALSADRGAAEIGAALGAAQERLAAAAAGRVAAEQATIAAAALSLAAEVDTENVIRRIEARVLEAVNKKRGLDPYARLFPGNLEGALAPGGRAQATLAGQLADLIAPSAGERLVGVTDEIARFAPELREHNAVLLSRVAGLEAAEAAAVAAYGAELTSRRRWREQYRKTHGLVTAMYASDRRKVESFFKSGKRAKKKATDKAPD